MSHKLTSVAAPDMLVSDFQSGAEMSEQELESPKPSTATKPISVPSKPHMPREAVDFLEQRMRACRCYLEFGSGGSTRMAVKLGVPHVLSVESDLAFGREVRRRVSHNNKSTSNFKMFCPSIGPTRAWGYPANNDQCQKWHQYLTKVWEHIFESGLSPDLILIDGRFRAACFLLCVLNSRPGTTIMFDDYYGREKRYASIERHLKPEKTIARVAVFQRPAHIDPVPVAMDLLRFSNQTG